VTTPIWMALPPEVHSALLSTGPGPGSLLAGAGAWNSLSATYASVADELSAILAAVQAGAWEGPSAEQYVAAHVPYLMWLMQASADSAGTAARYETAATAYTVALAAMPTLVQLAANHAIHAALLATNFFGINTIPIALNEAEYVWMWIQAAATMAQYELTSSSAVTSAPQTVGPPQIVKPIQSSDSSDTGAGVPKIVDNDAGNPYQLSWWTNRFLEVSDTLERDILEFPQNPSAATQQLASDIAGLTADEVGHAAEAYEAFFPEINALALTLSAFNPGFLGGLGGLGAVDAIQPQVIPVAAEPAPQTPSLSVSSSSPPVSAAAAAGPAPSSAPAPAPAPASTAAPATAGPPPPPAGMEQAAFPYLVGGPTMGSSSGMSAGARRKAPEPDIAAAAAAAAASAREKERARRRRRAGMRGYGDEYMDMNVEVEPDWGDPSGVQPGAVASDRGAGNLGFAGTASKQTAAEAAGLATLAGDEFGGGPSMPMLPRTWEPDERELGEGDRN
jgi:PPE-repeat protein